MKKVFALSILLLLIAFLLAACTSSPNTPLPQADFTATLTSTAHPTETPRPTNTPQPSPTRTNTPQPTHTHTSTPLPTLAPVGNWLAPAIEIQWANGNYRYAWWVDNTSVAMYDRRDRRVTITLDALSGKMISVATPTSYVVNNSSGTENFEIVCGKAELEMVRLPEREVVSRSDLAVPYCSAVNWASDSSAAVLVTTENEVFVWRSDGTAPYQVGDGWYGIWSPDSTKLLIINSIPARNPDVATFNIAYADERPLKITGAVIEAGNEWELTTSLIWLTNDIVRNQRGCIIPNYCHQDYYHAESGKFLIRNIISDIGGQEAFLSPNQRWLVMEVESYAENWEERYKYHLDSKIRLVMYDLKQLTSHTWATGKLGLPASSGLSVEFIGWSTDSRQFYFVYYPYDNLSANLPVGYSRLDRNTLKTHLLVPNVIFTKLSPDSQFIFMVTAERIEEQMAYGVKAAIYTLEGKPVSELQFIADQLPFEALHPTDFYNEGDYDPYADLIPSQWNPAGTEIVLAEPNGNLWLKSTNGETTQIVSGLSIKPYWQEKIRFNWSPDGQLLLFHWGQRAWVIQIHQP